MLDERDGLAILINSLGLKSDLVQCIQGDMRECKKCYFITQVYSGGKIRRHTTTPHSTVNQVESNSSIAPKAAALVTKQAIVYTN